MTSNELLHTSLLDIIFNNRNKEYGAYALRKSYNNRLLLSLVTGLFIGFFFTVASSLFSEPVKGSAPFPDNNGRVTVIEWPEEKITDPKPPLKKADHGSLKPKPAEPIPKIEFPPVVIVPDDVADPEPVASAADIKNKKMASVNADGTDGARGIAPGGTGIQEHYINENLPAPEKNILPDSNPEFPGGNDALMKFLSRHLNIPAELEADEKRMVKARFKVSGDGLVSWVEIVQSGGELFDKEVIRVCKKMPKWKPAIQNGVAVPVSYVLPVTFIRMDQ